MNENLNPESDNLSNEDLDVEKKLRPLSFDDFTGQDQAIDNLKIFVEAANQREEALDHTLFHGPPGLSKTGPEVTFIPTCNSFAKICASVVFPKPGGP